MPEPSNPDVVVIGYGPAGASAAIAAHDAGARVVILEASDHGGGNAIYSGGFLFDLPMEKVGAHLAALSFGRTDTAVLDAYGDGLHELEPWLASIGGNTEAFAPPPIRLPAPFPSWPLSTGADVTYRVVSGGTGRRGAALWDVLDSAVRERGIEVRLGSPAARLIVAGDRVSGVVVGNPEADLLAEGGVVLACGGFEGNPALTDAYLPLGPCYPVGHPANTGFALDAAAQVQASLWHMYGFFGWFSFLTPDFDSPFAIDFFGASHAFVDADGHRFTDETGHEVHDRLRGLLTYLPRNPNRPRLPSWAIFDDAARLAGPLNGLLGTPNDYTWSTDNSVEVDRGWILTADSPAELAAQMQVDPSVLQETLDEYNGFCKAGRDDRFGRSPDTLTALDTRRLFAIPTWPGIAGTTGGPRHDERARVVRADHSAVPGLYTAGASSLVWGHLIDHGGGLTDAMVFGRIAGLEAALRARVAV